MAAWFSAKFDNLLNKFSKLKYIYFIFTFSLPIIIYFSYISVVYVFKPVNVEDNKNYLLVVNSGDSVHKIANRLKNNKIIQDTKPLVAFAKLRGIDKHIHAGEYYVFPGETMHNLLNNLHYGNVVNYSFTILEGSTFTEMLVALASHPKITLTLNGLTDAQVKEKLGIDNEYIDGLFLPETYYYQAFTTDVDILMRAKNHMDKFVNEAWESRQQNTTLKNKYQALILASIIEKESHVKDEYADISSVYHRRLESNMRLQADPTVIYGLKDEYAGKLYIKHLKHDSLFNTYKKSGLPPAPIAAPSRDAIYAAIHPSNNDALYFVATATGRHKFSRTLQEHNQAVAEYRASNKNNK